MNQPSFSDGPPVPLMVEGTVDAATLQQLFTDLTTAAVILAVKEKGGPASYALAGEHDLETARRRLLAGEARAIQLRYRFAEHEWTDTILAIPGGFRVVRCRHDP